MVKIAVDPSFEATVFGCMGSEDGLASLIQPWFLRISYPEVGEFEVFDTFRENMFDYEMFNSSQDGCLNSGWYYFYLPVIDPDPLEIWLKYADFWDPELFAIWTLTRYQ